MKNELITKEELLNAGATTNKPGTLYVLKIEDYPYSFYINPELNSLRVYYGECYHTESECPTREGFAFIVKTLTGKDLDFSPKQKDYSWEAVLMRQSASTTIDINNTIDELLNLRNDIGNKLIALLKLHYIIEELDRDFEGDGYTHRVFLNGSILLIESSKITYCNGELIVLSEQSARILIDNHAQLLKDALGVK